MLTRLEDLAGLSSSYPFRKAVESEAGGDLVLVQIKDVDGEQGVSGTGAVRLRDEGGRYRKYLLQAGDLLFQSRGSRHPVAVIESSIRGIAATGLHTIRPRTGTVLSGYLAWWLNHPRTQAKIRDELARGTYVPFVSVRDLGNLNVPLPSLEAQRQIVEIDRLRRRERELTARHLELTQQLVDAATHAAVTGQP